MKYYKIIFNNIPNVQFAHSYTTENYDINFNVNKNLFEIAYIEKGEIVKTYQSGNKQLVPAPCISFSPKAEKCHCKSPAPLHKHFTVGISAEYEIHEITYEQIVKCYQSAFSDNNTNCLMAIIPEITVDNKCLDTIEAMIKKIISEHSSSKYSKNLSCISYVLNILSVLTDWSVKQVLTQKKSDVSFSDTVYCDKAIAYIAKNIHQKISVEEIATNLKISTGHLSRLFKAVTGRSIIEYSNRLKIKFVKELIDTKNVNLSEAGKQIGIFDEKYLCRLFKKYAGMTITEYKLM